jgi:hypothetical protein
MSYTGLIGGAIAAAELFNEPTMAASGGTPPGYDASAFARDEAVFRALCSVPDGCFIPFAIQVNGVVSSYGTFAKATGSKTCTAPLGLSAATLREPYGRSGMRRGRPETCDQLYGGCAGQG